MASIPPVPKKMDSKLGLDFLEKLRQSVNGRVNTGTYSSAEIAAIEDWKPGDIIFNSTLGQLGVFNGNTNTWRWM